MKLSKPWCVWSKQLKLLTKALVWVRTARKALNLHDLAYFGPIGLCQKKVFLLVRNIYVIKFQSIFVYTLCGLRKRIFIVGDSHWRKAFKAFRIFVPKSFLILVTGEIIILICQAHPYLWNLKGLQWLKHF